MTNTYTITTIKQTIKALETQYETLRTKLKAWWVTNHTRRFYPARPGQKPVPTTDYKTTRSTFLQDLRYTRKAITYWRDKLATQQSKSRKNKPVQTS